MDERDLRGETRMIQLPNEVSIEKKTIRTCRLNGSSNARRLPQVRLTRLICSLQGASQMFSQAHIWLPSANSGILRDTNWNMFYEESIMYSFITCGFTLPELILISELTFEFWQRTRPRPFIMTQSRGSRKNRYLELASVTESHCLGSSLAADNRR